MATSKTDKDGQMISVHIKKRCPLLVYKALVVLI